MSGLQCCLGVADTTRSQLNPSAGIPVWAGNTGSLEAGCRPAGRSVPRQHQPLSSARGEERGSCHPSCLKLHRPCFGASVISGALPAQGCVTVPVPVPDTDVTCDEWSFYLLPLDEDIISMELPEFFRDYFLVSGTLCWGDSPSRPPCLTGAGDRVLLGRRRVVPCSALSLHHGPRALPRGSFCGAVLARP